MSRRNRAEASVTLRVIEAWTLEHLRTIAGDRHEYVSTPRG
jgi:hypothetical protein